jgi:hypothetical protein
MMHGAQSASPERPLNNRRRAYLGSSALAAASAFCLLASGKEARALGICACRAFVTDVVDTNTNSLDVCVVFEYADIRVRTWRVCLRALCTRVVSVRTWVLLYVVM